MNVIAISIVRSLFHDPDVGDGPHPPAPAGAPSELPGAGGAPLRGKSRTAHGTRRSRSRLLPFVLVGGETLGAESPTLKIQQIQTDVIYKFKFLFKGKLRDSGGGDGTNGQCSWIWMSGLGPLKETYLLYWCLC